MTRDDIIAMAREAGWHDELLSVSFTMPLLERFFHVAQAAERNKVALWMMAQGYATGHGDTTEDLLQELGVEIKAKIAAEREACAEVSESFDACEPKHIAAAIRARGQA